MERSTLPATAADPRPSAMLSMLLFGVALLTYAAGVPLGLDRLAGAGTVADGVSLGLPGSEVAVAPPLGLLAIRAAAFLPLGDVAARGNLMSALLGAIAVAMLAQLAREAQRALRPSPTVRRRLTDRAHHVTSAAAGALVAGATLGVFVALTSAGAGAVTLLVVVAGVHTAVRLARHWL